MGETGRSWIIRQWFRSEKSVYSSFRSIRRRAFPGLLAEEVATSRDRFLIECLLL